MRRVGGGLATRLVRPTASARAGGRSRRERVFAIVVVALALAGCGSSARPTLTVSAAASLQRALTAYASQFHGATVRLSFAGSDLLAAQIEQGAAPDVFASANTALPRLLFARHLVERPVAFAANRLVVAVPRGSRRVHAVADLERPGVSIAIGSPSVPAGAYARAVLARLPAVARARILANVRTTEPDVSAVIGKVTEDAVDAGFVYATDVAATGGAADAVPLPAELQPRVGYAAAVAVVSSHKRLAHEFLAGLLTGAGRRDLVRSGFEPPP